VIIENLRIHRHHTDSGFRFIGNMAMTRGGSEEGVHFHSSGPVTLKQATQELRESYFISKDESVVALEGCGTDSSGREGFVAVTDLMRRFGKIRFNSSVRSPSKEPRINTQKMGRVIL
jgi:hypothetical protein